MVLRETFFNYFPYPLHTKTTVQGDSDIEIIYKIKLPKEEN